MIAELNNTIEEQKAQIKALEEEKNTKIKELEAKWEEMKKGGVLLKNEVDEDMVAGILSKWTGIPAGKMLTNEKERYLNIEKHLKDSVIGQDEALHALSRAIKRNKAGISKNSSHNYTPACVNYFIISASSSNSAMSAGLSVVLIETVLSTIVIFFICSNSAFIVLIAVGAQEVFSTRATRLFWKALLLR